MKESLYALLDDLTALDGAPGHEQPVVAYLRDALTPLADAVEVDAMGNLYAIKRGAAPGPRLMISAHSDEIGGLVRSVDPHGFMRLSTLGAVSPALLVGRRVRVRGRLGVIGVKSVHLQSPEERRTVLPSEDLYIDVGANSAAQVAAMGIRIGDPWVYHSPLERLGEGDRVTGKAIDNRIGCAVLVQLLRELQREPLVGTLCAVACVQEEIRMRGAQVAAYRLQPDYAVVVDTFMAGDTPDVDYYRELPACIGQGPVLLVANSAHIGHPAVNRYLEQAAARAGVALQRCTVTSEAAATDAGAIHLSRQGVPTAGLSLARRYSHSPVCTLDLNDAVGAVRVLRQFVADMPGHGDLSFFAGD